MAKEKEDLNIKVEEVAEQMTVGTIMVDKEGDSRVQWISAEFGDIQPAIDEAFKGVKKDLLEVIKENGNHYLVVSVAFEVNFAKGEIYSNTVTFEVIRIIKDEEFEDVMDKTPLDKLSDSDSEKLHNYLYRDYLPEDVKEK